MGSIVPALQGSTGPVSHPTPPPTPGHESPPESPEYRSLANLAMSHLPGLLSALSSSVVGALGHVPAALEGALGRALVRSPIHRERRGSVHARPSL